MQHELRHVLQWIILSRNQICPVAAFFGKAKK